MLELYVDLLCKNAICPNIVRDLVNFVPVTFTKWMALLVATIQYFFYNFFYSLKLFNDYFRHIAMKEVAVVILINVDYYGDLQVKALIYNVTNKTFMEIKQEIVGI